MFRTSMHNQVSGMIHMARDGSWSRAKTPVVWEVYVGAGRLSTEVSKLGAHVERFGLNEGWDFSLSTHRRAFLHKIDTDEPDEMFMSPKCTLWSPMQNINIKCAADAADLEERSGIDHGTHLSMCHKAYWKQVRAGCVRTYTFMWGWTSICHLFWFEQEGYTSYTGYTQYVAGFP